jgi:protein gp37
MGDRSKIEWLGDSGATWNPITGCTKVSPGCDHCYAETLIGRFEQTWGDFATVRLREERLDQPIRWKRPRRIFVNSMSDLFHKDIPNDYIHKVFDVMCAADHHIYQVLTKRSSCMMKWVRDERPEIPDYVWLGVSVEDKKRKVRINHLRKTPAPSRFLSCEPLLGDLGELDLEGIGWVIVGGESGSDARPMHPQWVRSIRDQCTKAGVPFFFKQWGAWIPLNQYHGRSIPAFANDGNWNPRHDGWGTLRASGQWLEHTISNHEDCVPVIRVGKKQAGSLLDGTAYQENP